MELNRAELLAIELMGQHGLLGADFVGYKPSPEVAKLRVMFASRGTLFTFGTRWHFKFDTARRRFGCCQYRHRTITLSKALVSINDEAEVRNTILHEIAHALCPTNAGHGPMWKAMASAVGARPVRCYSLDTVATITAKWVWDCRHCREHNEVIMRNKPGSGWGKTCMNCYNAAKARGAGFNIGTYTFEWRKVCDIVKQPKGVANNPAPEPVVEVASLARPWIPPLNTVPNPAITPAGVRFNPAQCVELYQAGHKVVDIAVGMGYKRGHGQNRVRAALMKAGVYNSNS